MAPKTGQGLVQALKTEYESQSIFHLTDNAGRSIWEQKAAGPE
jgi:hypothetical protein